MTEVGPPVPRSDFRLPRSRAMRRILIVSHTYIPPSNRGKLRALAARGLEVTVGVPQRWRETVLGLTLEVAWERQNGVEVFPLPVRHHGDPAALVFGGRALHALVRDKRPDLVQVEEEPTSPAARQVVLAMAHRAGIPLNRIGDRQGCRFVDGRVTTPEGFREAYGRFTEAGWGALDVEPAYGGGGLPTPVALPKKI